MCSVYSFKYCLHLDDVLQVQLNIISHAQKDLTIAQEIAQNWS